MIVIKYLEKQNNPYEEWTVKILPKTMKHSRSCRHSITPVRAITV